MNDHYIYYYLSGHLPSNVCALFDGEIESAPLQYELM